MNQPFFLSLLLLAATSATSLGAAETTDPAPVAKGKIGGLAPRNITGPHYAEAVRLYRQGPDFAEPVIVELDKEIEDYPSSASARILKARTLKGIGRFDEALAVLDELSELTSSRNTISPSAQYLRAECLFHKGDYVGAKAAIEPFQAFFQSPPVARKQYEELMVRINARLGLSVPQT